MKKLEIGPNDNRSITPDGEAPNTWDTLDTAYQATYQSRWGEKLPIDDATYDWVHASHVLEHIPWWKTMDALTEAYRILKFDGRFTVWVPDAIKIIELHESNPEEFLKNEANWNCGFFNSDKDPWVYLNARVFWGARPGEVGQEQHFHKAMFGFNSLSRLLTQAGFSNINRIERNVDIDCGHGWMEVGLEGFR